MRLYKKTMKLKTGKFISIIIPTYNREGFLQKAIESVLAQTYPYYELIVVDDGSVDNTTRLIETYNSDIVYIQQENRGPAAARNRGICAARYNLLAFLDSDDRYAENKLEMQVKAMQEKPDYFISHTQEIWYRNGRILNQRKKHKKNSGNIFNQSLKLCAVGMSTVLMHRKIFDHYGMFDEDYPCCEDYEFWLRVGAEQKFLLIDQPLTLKDGGREDQVSSVYRVGMDRFRIRAILKILATGDGLTDEQRGAALAELRRKCRIYGTGCIKHGRIEEGRYYLSLPLTTRSQQTL